MDRKVEGQTYESLVYSEYSRGHLTEIPDLLCQGYERVDELLRLTPWLTRVDPKVTRGILIRSAVHDVFYNRVKLGQWPHTPTIQEYTAPGGQYLEIRSTRSILSIHRVKWISAFNTPAFPRRAGFLDNQRIAANDPAQLCMAFRQALSELQGSLPRFVLVYGGEERPEFAFAAIPDHQRRRYLWRTPNLMNRPFAVPAPGVEVEDTGKIVTFGFKQDIAAAKADKKTD